MNYLRLPNAIIDRVEKWEHRRFYGNDAVYNEFPLRYKRYTFTSAVYQLLGIIYIGAPLLVGLILVSKLPLSSTGQWLGMILYTLIIMIVSLVLAVRLWRRGHRM